MENSKNNHVKNPDADESKSKRLKSGFDAPMEGIVVPDNVKAKKRQDGRVEYFYSDGIKWKG